MESYAWFVICTNLQLILFVLSATVNSTLLLMIIFKSPHKIGSYRYLMITFSFFCIVFSSITYVAEPTSVAHGQVYIIFAKRNNPVQHDRWKHYLVCMYSTCLGILMYLISTQFFYRFCLICKPKLIFIFKGKYLVIWYFGILFVGIDWMFLTVVLADRTHEMENAMRETLKSEFFLDIYQVEFIGIQFFTKSEGIITWNSPTLFLILNVTVLMSIFCTTTVYCAIRTYKHSLSGLESSDHHDKFNSQIFIALVTQACIPLVFMFLPITLLIIIPLFDLSPKFLVQASAISISTYPILDPLAVVFIVSSYRRCLRDFFRPRSVSSYLKNMCSVVDEDYDMDVL